MLNSLICTYCANAHNEPCLTQCAPQRSYRAFEPRPLREREQQPTFPVADFLQMTAREARVLLGLYLFWQSQQPCTERSEREAGVRTLSHNGHHGLPIYLRERRPS